MPHQLAAAARFIIGTGFDYAACFIRHQASAVQATVARALANPEGYRSLSIHLRHDLVQLALRAGEIDAARQLRSLDTPLPAGSPAPEDAAQRSTFQAFKSFPENAMTPRPAPPQTRRVDADLTIRFQDAIYSVPFAEIGQNLPVLPAAGRPGVLVFPDGWNPGISASAFPARNRSGTRRNPSKPMPLGTGSIARKKQARGRAADQGAHLATRPARLRNRKPDSAAWAARAIHLLPLPAEPSEPAQKSRDGKTGSGNRRP